MSKQLSLEQRYAIFLGLKEKKTYTAIAQQVGVSVSTVSREVKRNSNRHGQYFYKVAQELAEVKRERSAANGRKPQWVVRRALKLLVDEDWSPRQISGYLRLKEGIHISHERIYAEIRADETGDLRKHTRHGMKYRRHKARRRVTKATNIPNRTSIHERPPEADGTRFSDWELDLVVGKGHKSALVTLVERSTNYVLIAYTPNKKPKEIASIVKKMLLPFKGRGLKTITTDNGFEFAAHETFAKALNCSVYFADSYCSWQKGAIENTNKLIRQYFPKGTDFRTVSRQEIMWVQKRLNSRPRQKLNFECPKNCFYKHFL